jgi:hypothetical protein
MKLEQETKILKVSAQGAVAAGLAGASGIMHLPVFAAETPRKENPAAWITSLIADYVANSPANSIKNAENERAWTEPLVGFSRGDDSIYQLYKEKSNIGPFHWTPLEIFNLTFPEISVKPEELSVIAWILPHTESIKADLRTHLATPSEKWIRDHGRDFNEDLRRVADTPRKPLSGRVPIFLSVQDGEFGNTHGVIGSNGTPPTPDWYFRVWTA